MELYAHTASLQAQPGTLDIHWMDVEGGGGALFISPSGESMLVDTGWPRPEGWDARCW